MDKNKKGAGKIKKIYKGARRLNPIWEQGAGKWQKLEGKKDEKGAGRMIKVRKWAYHVVDS